MAERKDAEQNEAVPEVVEQDSAGVYFLSLAEFERRRAPDAGVRSNRSRRPT